MGQAAVAAGTGVSLLGGIFESLGMEEFGMERGMKLGSAKPLETFMLSLSQLF